MITGPILLGHFNTFAITFLRNGGSPLELQAILGHEKLDTETIYALLAQVDLQVARGALRSPWWK